MSRSLHVTTILMVVLGMILPSHSAMATTEAENTRAQAPMPHKNLGSGGSMVKAHFTRLDGYLEGRPDNASQLAQMKTQAQQCMREHRETGMATNPPRAWPDFVLSDRTDRYVAANRTIVYHFNLAYGLQWSNCGLLETAAVEATLSSAIGTCNIDLIKKTATGVCDALGHGNAAPPIRVPVATHADVEAAIKKLHNNPGLAALAAVMRQHPPGGTGERKTILGLECEVWKNPLDPNGTTCLATGGSFMASDINGLTGQSNMNLETISIAGIKEHAVEAKLDAMVNSAVFAPYLAAGFTIKNTVPRK